jgi:hypothetical protein
MTNGGVQTAAGERITVKNIRKCVQVKQWDRNQLYAFVKMVINNWVP